MNISSEDIVLNLIKTILPYCGFWVPSNVEKCSRASRTVFHVYYFLFFLIMILHFLLILPGTLFELNFITLLINSSIAFAMLQNTMRYIIASCLSNKILKIFQTLSGEPYFGNKFSSDIKISLNIAKSRSTKRTLLFIIIILISLFSAGGIRMILPMLNEISLSQNQTHEAVKDEQLRKLSLNCWYPFDYQISPMYEIVQCLQMIYIVCSMITILSTDLIIIYLLIRVIEESKHLQRVSAMMKELIPNVDSEYTVRSPNKVQGVIIIQDSQEEARKYTNFPASEITPKMSDFSELLHIWIKQHISFIR